MCLKGILLQLESAIDDVKLSSNEKGFTSEGRYVSILKTKANLFQLGLTVIFIFACFSFGPLVPTTIGTRKFLIKQGITTLFWLQSLSASLRLISKMSWDCNLQLSQPSSVQLH